MLRGKKWAPTKTGESCPDLRRPQGSFVQCAVWARSPVLPETTREQGLRSDFDFGQRALDFVESDPVAIGAQASPVSLPLGAPALSVRLMRQKGVETVFAWGQVRLRQQRRGGHAAHHVLGGEQRRLSRQPRLLLAPAAEVSSSSARYCARPVSMTATDLGLNGLPRSLRWPCSASDAEIARRLRSCLSAPEPLSARDEPRAKLKCRNPEFVRI